MTDTSMVARKRDGDPPPRPPLVDEQLADQLLGKAQEQGVELLASDRGPDAGQVEEHVRVPGAGGADGIQPDLGQLIHRAFPGSWSIPRMVSL